MSDTLHNTATPIPISITPTELDIFSFIFVLQTFDTYGVSDILNFTVVSGIASRHSTIAYHVSLRTDTK